MGFTARNLGKAHRQRKQAGVLAMTGEATTGREQRKSMKSFREMLGENGTVSQASRKEATGVRCRWEEKQRTGAEAAIGVEAEPEEGASERRGKGETAQDEGTTDGKG